MSTSLGFGIFPPCEPFSIDFPGFWLSSPVIRSVLLNTYKRRTFEVQAHYIRITEVSNETTGIPYTERGIGKTTLSGNIAWLLS
jgi:hypothetical protein